MNYRSVLRMTGLIMVMEAAFMVLPMLVALIYHESSGVYFLLPAACLLCCGLGLSRIRANHRELYARDGFAIVSFSWIVISIVGAIPFYFSRQIPSFVDAVFETTSGFTTTGASILTDIEALDRCMLFWRSFTHFAGGMGVLVFMLAIARMSGGESLHLLRAESPGPTVDKITPKTGSTAKILYGIYTGMTALEFVLLLISGMPSFDALVVSLGTAGTGGFAIVNAGIAAYTSVQQVIITVFMLLFGVNFSCYFFLLTRRFRQAFMEEARWYLGIFVAATAFISINVFDFYGSVGKTVQQVAFQTASLMSSTGFSTTDFNLWPEPSKCVLVLLMFIGACAGSTGGGFKVSRVMILAKAFRAELAALTHPRKIRILRLNGKAIANDTVRRTSLYLVGYCSIILLSVVLLSFDPFSSFTEDFTAVVTTLNNIGPGLGRIGPTGNFASYSAFSKIVLMINMLLGRLEIFPILVLLSPSTWKRR